MNELQVFTNEQFGSVRIKEIDGEPWFIAADVCKALELGNATMALDRLDADERTLISIEGSRNGVPVNAVNEAGLYILVMGSRKECAKGFKRWIAHDVVPAIRKHGMYAKDELLDNPDLLIEVATKLKEERAKRKILEQQNAALLPKGEYYDALVDRNGLTNLRDTAKLLGVPPQAFTDALINDSYIYRTSKGEHRFYAEANKGYFTVKEFVRHGHAGIQVLVTVKGREHFMRLYAKKLA